METEKHGHTHLVCETFSIFVSRLKFSTHLHFTEGYERLIEM